ncbi:DUF4232 domain-containing protein [Streptomyces sp. XM4193]|uniref:DUF4232 domain-containing protein n=1 Tax=Streptomyces sp. XM4193 TaxID=2929782 RepID=UPI001FFA08AE|nr:DUF4232 domain-containing protein [Streptomyces sp. XM4193]MCK1795282.1 DUF4232 domain-containing protein [Streptomyces sp. XM4193]
MRIAKLPAAITVVIAALALTACGEDEPLRSSNIPGPSTSAEGSADENTESAENTDGDQDGSNAGKAPNGQKENASDGPARENGGARTDCTVENTSVRAAEVSRPVNTMLLTVTNTGSTDCDLKNYPYLKFTGAQSVPPPIESSKPQAVVTLAPGAKGYAAIRLSAADGSGDHGYRATTLEVGFQKDGMTNVRLPKGGVHIDSSLTVTYWQSTADDALMH